MTPLTVAPLPSESDLAAFCAPPGLLPLEPVTVASHRADAHWLAYDPAGQIVARCSLWRPETPLYPGHRPGLIGHYAAANAAAGRKLLATACQQLAAAGCTIAIGPIDGNTWRAYRLVTWSSTEPPFFLEPNNPPDWPGHFTASGFAVLARYVSTLNPELDLTLPRLAPVAAHAARRGIEIRPLDPANFEEELGRIYRLSRASFSRNLLYSPISQSQFRAMYKPLRPHLRPELILLAEQAGQLVGFVFGLPDLLQAQRGEAGDTIIIKTAAVHPAYRHYGLGSLLVERCQQAAHQLGYRRAIHALMHEANESYRISQRYPVRLIRRYALFSRQL